MGQAMEGVNERKIGAKPPKLLIVLFNRVLPHFFIYFCNFSITFTIGEYPLEWTEDFLLG